MPEHINLDGAELVTWTNDDGLRRAATRRPDERWQTTIGPGDQHSTEALTRLLNEPGYATDIRIERGGLIERDDRAELVKALRGLLANPAPCGDRVVHADYVNQSWDDHYRARHVAQAALAAVGEGT